MAAGRKRRRLSPGTDGIEPGDVLALVGDVQIPGSALHCELAFSGGVQLFLFRTTQPMLGGPPAPRRFRAGVRIRQGAGASP